MPKAMKTYIHRSNINRKTVTQQHFVYEWQPSQYQSNIVGHLIIKSNWVARKKGSYFTGTEKIHDKQTGAFFVITNRSHRF